MMRSNLVDLYTPDDALEYLMLSLYPGTLSEDQVREDDSLDEKIHCFYGLQKSAVEKLLSLYKGQFTYEVVDCDTGERFSFNAAQTLH